MCTRQDNKGARLMAVVFSTSILNSMAGLWSINQSVSSSSSLH